MKVLDSDNLIQMTDTINFKNDWFRQNDFISINSVRLSNMFSGDGSLIYSIDHNPYK